MTEIIVEHSFAILGPKSVRPTHWPQPRPKISKYTPLVSLLINDDRIKMYKSMAVVPMHVLRTLCKVRSKVFCRFHPFFHCLFLAACAACKNQWILDGKYCQNRSRYPKQRYQTLANLQQTRSCTRKWWTYLLTTFILRPRLFHWTVYSSEQQVETTGVDTGKTMHWAL